MSMPFQLSIERGPHAGQRVPIAAEMTIGRQAGNTLTLDDGELSRHHARLDLRDGVLTVTDLGSANGTAVNGQRITASHPLQPGDLVELGATTLRVEAAGFTGTMAAAPPAPDPVWTAQPQAPAPPPAPARPASTNRLPLIIGGIVGGLLLLCVCGGLGTLLILHAARGGQSAPTRSVGGNGSGSGGGAGSSSSSSRRKAGRFTGRITDGSGQPIRVAGAKATASLQCVSGNGNVSATPDANGFFDVAIIGPAENQCLPIATLQVTYAGKQYHYQLDPMGVDPAKSVVRDGIAQDFRWLLSGAKPGSSTGAHYGGDIYLDFEVFPASSVPDGAKITVMLTPQGALADGSAGKVVTFQSTRAEVAANSATPQIRDLPLDTYRVTATVTQSSGGSRALNIGPPGTTTITAAQQSYDLIFSPEESYIGGLVSTSLSFWAP